MCICHRFHHHHRAPCGRPPSYSISFDYCPSAPLHPSTNAPISPCAKILYEPDFTLMPGPCIAGYCIASPQCKDGTCRLQDLGGLWICCQCGGRGNRLLNCRSRQRGSPDTFCYHDICPRCAPDRR